MSLTEVKREYHALLHSWEYAFAMGHGCSMGMQPGAAAIRARADRLRRTIRVLEATTYEPPFSVSPN